MERTNQVKNNPMEVEKVHYLNQLSMVLEY